MQEVTAMFILGACHSCTSPDLLQITQYTYKPICLTSMLVIAVSLHTYCLRLFLYIINCYPYTKKYWRYHLRCLRTCIFSKSPHWSNSLFCYTVNFSNRLLNIKFFHNLNSTLTHVSRHLQEQPSKSVCWAVTRLIPAGSLLCMR